MGALVLGGCLGGSDLASAPPAQTQGAPPSCPVGEVQARGACTPAAEAYAPSGTAYVVAGRDSRASDANPGTEERPWATLAHAARTLRPGDAVLVRGGVYRESIEPVRGGTDADHRITYAAYPGERVVVTGADRIPDGWTSLGEGLWRRPWTFPAWAAYSDDPVFRRELVVAGGRVLRAVHSRQALRPGTQWVAGTDLAPTTLTVSLPGTVRPDDVEVATRARLFWPVASRPDAPCGDASQPAWLRVAGFTFRHASNRAQWGALCAGSAHGVIEDVTVEWTVGQGVDGSGRGHVFRRVRSDYNGQLGWGAACTDCLFEEGSAVGNNWAGHDPFWEAGGGKWSRTRGSVIRRFYVADNHGPGLWLDGTNRQNTLEGNRVVRNEVAGILLELETTETLVQHNVVEATRWREWSGSGILSQAASRNLLLHNTIVGNDGTGLWLRLDPLRRAPDVGSVVVANRVEGNARTADEAREIAVEAADERSRRSHRFAANRYGRPSGDPVLLSTFFLSPVGSGDYRGSDLATWSRLTGDRGSMLVPEGLVDLRRRPSLPRIGAVSAPPRLSAEVGAAAERVRAAPTAGSSGSRSAPRPSSRGSRP